jgi:hypothetical protein
MTLCGKLGHWLKLIVQGVVERIAGRLSNEIPGQPSIFRSTRATKAIVMKML